MIWTFLIDALKLLQCKEVAHLFVWNDLQSGVAAQQMITEWVTDWVMPRCSAKDSFFSCRELNPIGSRALSHDSIFIPEEPVTEPGLDHDMSQEKSDKVRNLQVRPRSDARSVPESFICFCPHAWRVMFFLLLLLLKQKQIAQGIKFGQRPPSLRKSEGDEGSSDEEEVPRSPLKVLAQVEAEPASTEPKVKMYYLIMMSVWCYNPD